MNNLIAKFADAVTPALIALPMAIALSTVAHAEPMKVRVGDLDLASRAGQAAFAQRVDRAAQDFCAGQKSLSQHAACTAGISAEAQQKAASLETSSHYAQAAEIAAR